MTGEQQPATTGGQPLQATATAPQTEAKAPDESVKWQALAQAIKDAEARAHSKLRTEGAYMQKCIAGGQMEISSLKGDLAKLHEEMDGMIAKGEGGVDVAKKAKEIRERELALAKKEQLQALKEAQIEEDAKALHSTKLNDLIEDLCTAKESDPTAKAQLIANVKSFNPKTQEDVERIVGLLNVKPAVKTPEATDLKGGGAGKIVPTGSPMELARQAYSKTK